MTTIKTETTDSASRPKAAPRKKKKMRLRFRLPPRWKRYAFYCIGIPMVLLSFVMAYYWVVFSRMIDARMSGEMARTDPRVFARPFELHRGQALTERQLIDQLNDLGYAHRARAERPGEFTVGRDALVLIPRDGDHKGRTVRLVFGGRPAKTAEPAQDRDNRAAARQEDRRARHARPAAHHGARHVGGVARSAATFRCRPSRGR